MNVKILMSGFALIGLVGCQAGISDPVGINGEQLVDSNGDGIPDSVASQSPSQDAATAKEPKSADPSSIDLSSVLTSLSVSDASSHAEDGSYVVKPETGKRGFDSVTLSLGSGPEAKICKSQSVLGVQGTATCITETANTVSMADQILAGTSAFDSNGHKVDGVMVDRGMLMIGDLSQKVFEDGYYSSIVVTGNATAGQVCSGQSVFGVSGSAVCQSSKDAQSTVIVPSQICSGYGFWNESGVYVEGTKTCEASVEDLGISVKPYTWLSHRSYQNKSEGNNDTTKLYVWNDLSGNHHDVIQSDADDRPIIHINVFGTKKALYFDGKDARMTGDFAPAVGSQPRTLVAVIKNGQVNSGHYNHIIHYGGTSDFQSYGLAFKTWWHEAKDNTDGESRLSGNIGNNYERQSYASTQAPNASPMILVQVFDGHRDTLYVNGLAAGSSLEVPLDTKNTREFTVGARAGGTSSELFKGHIGEILAFDSALSVTDRRALECYLHKQFNIVIATNCSL